MGPTASGKTSAAIELAQRLQAEIISIDSMQVYRGMDIGTAKPGLLERRGITHHMVDIVDPSQEFTVSEFRAMARAVLEDRSDQPTVIVGGSGLHFRAIVDPMSFAPTDPAVRAGLDEQDLADLVETLVRIDPEAGDHVALQNKRRVVRALEIHQLVGQTPSQRAATEEAAMIRRYESELEFNAVGIDAGERTGERIEARLDSMRHGGLVDEVKGLKNEMGRTASAAVGYREILDFLDDRHSLEEALTRIGRNTSKLARRQRTWFQRDPRIQWIPWSANPADMAERVIEVLK